MTDLESRVLAWMQCFGEKLDAFQAEMSDNFGEVEERMGRIEGELLVISGVMRRLEAREIETMDREALRDLARRRLAQVEARLAALEGPAGQ